MGQFVAVGFVLMLLGVAVWALRRGRLEAWSGATQWLVPVSRLGNTAPMERAGRLVLTPQHSLHLVRIRGRELIVATHPGGCSVVRENISALECGTGSE